MDPGAQRQVVVAGAIVRDGRLLAARRTAPPSAAGRWELPGGKVEPGETEAGSLVRELAEELGVRVRVERWLDGAAQIDERFLLRVAVVVLLDGDPEPTEHDAVRWLAPAELDEVDWLDADRPFLPGLSELIPTLDR